MPCFDAGKISFKNYRTTNTGKKYYQLLNLINHYSKKQFLSTGPTRIKIEIENIL